MERKESMFCHECMKYVIFIQVSVKEIERVMWVCGRCGSEQDRVLEYLRTGVDE